MKSYPEKEQEQEKRIFFMLNYYDCTCTKQNKRVRANTHQNYLTPVVDNFQNIMGRKPVPPRCNSMFD
jgi:hypothetical protein